MLYDKIYLCPLLMHVANACFSKVVEGAYPVRGYHKVKDAH